MDRLPKPEITANVGEPLMVSLPSAPPLEVSGVEVIGGVVTRLTLTSGPPPYPYPYEFIVMPELTGGEDE